MAKEVAKAKLSHLRTQAASGPSDFKLHERILALELELQIMGHSKVMLGKDLQEVITLTSQELEEELQESRGFRRKINHLEMLNKKLAVEMGTSQGGSQTSASPMRLCRSTTA